MICDDVSNMEHIMEADALRDSSMFSHMVSENTVEENPPQCPMMELEKRHLQTNLNRLCFSLRASILPRQRRFRDDVAE